MPRTTGPQAQQDAEADEEVGERYGPHRTATSRLILLCYRSRRSGTPLRPGAVQAALRLRRSRRRGGTGGLPDELLKNLKNSESGRSRKRVSLLRRPVLVGLHRAVEREEIRILAERFGEHAGCVRRRRRRASARPCELASAIMHGDFAVGPRPDLLRLLARPGRGTRRPRAAARSASAGRPPGCSAPADRRAGSAHRRPRCRSRSASLSSCSRIRAIRTVALVAHHLDEGDLAEHAAQRRVEQRGQLDVGAPGSLPTLW